MLKELPKYIAVKFTPENRNIINSWGKSHWKNKWGDINFNNYMIWDSENYCIGSDKICGYTEISFEDFKRLVLDNNEPIISIW